MYLNLFRCSARIIGSFFTRILQRNTHAQRRYLYACVCVCTMAHRRGKLYWPLLCFLLTAACLTVVFVFTAQSLCVAEVPGERARPHKTLGYSIARSQSTVCCESFSSDWLYNKSVLPETVCYWGVLLHVHREVQKIFIFAAHLSDRKRHAVNQLSFSLSQRG